MSNCQTCIHFVVCRDIEDKKNLENQIININTAYENDSLSVDVKCKNYVYERLTGAR